MKFMFSVQELQYFSETDEFSKFHWHAWKMLSSAKNIDVGKDIYLHIYIYTYVVYYRYVIYIYIYMYIYNLHLTSYLLCFLPYFVKNWIAFVVFNWSWIINT